MYLLLIASYLVEGVRRRVRAALGGHPESGALTLEWIVIAVLIAGAAVTAGAFFVSKITSYERGLP